MSHGVGLDEQVTVASTKRLSHRGSTTSCPVLKKPFGQTNKRWKILFNNLLDCVVDHLGILRVQRVACRRRKYQTNNDSLVILFQLAGGAANRRNVICAHHIRFTAPAKFGQTDHAAMLTMAQCDPALRSASLGALIHQS